ncbi:hypothetical protein ACFL4E_01070 [Candidatus Omnitrophota bacterium]
MKRSIVIIFLSFILIAFSAYAQAVQQTGVQIGSDVDEMELVRDEVNFQLYIYREVMQRLKEISESFSDGEISPDEALHKVTLLRHTYNQKSNPGAKETEQLNELVNKMMSRLENYFIYFKSSYREHPYLNAKVAETKFQVTQEADRLQYTYME